MKFSVKAKSEWSKTAREDLIDATLYGMHKLGLSSNINLLVKMVGNGWRVANQSEGACVHLGNSRYVIWIAPNVKRSTIFHELRHVWQYENEGLVLTNNEGCLYRGKLYSSFSLDDFEQYYNSPWEKDARKWERKLDRSYELSCWLGDW